MFNLARLVVLGVAGCFTWLVELGSGWFHFWLGSLSLARDGRKIRWCKRAVRATTHWHKRLIGATAPFAHRLILANDSLVPPRRSRTDSFSQTTHCLHAFMTCGACKSLITPLITHLASLTKRPIF